MNSAYSLRGGGIKVDRRSHASRRFRALTREALAHIRNPTFQQQAFAQRTAGLRMAVERMEDLLIAHDRRYCPKTHQRLVGQWMRATAVLSAVREPEMTLEQLFADSDEDLIPQRLRSGAKHAVADPHIAQHTGIAQRRSIARRKIRKGEA